MADAAECVTDQDEGRACVIGIADCRDGLVCNLLEVGTYPDEIGICRSCSVLCADADGPGEGCPKETTCECCPRGQRCETLGSWQRCVAYTPDGGGVDAGADAAPDVGLTWDAGGAADGDVGPDAEPGVADSLAGGE